MRHTRSLSPSPRTASVLRASAPYAALLILTLGLAAPRIAHAQVTTYSSLINFNAAAPPTTVFDFEGIAPTGDFVLSPVLTPLTVTVGGPNSTTESYAVTDSAAFNGEYSLNGTDSLTAALDDGFFPGTNSTTIAFGSSITAFGTEFGYRNGFATLSTGTLSVQLFNGATAVGAASVFSVTTPSIFIGLTSTQSFDQIRFTNTALSANTDASQVFDNVRIGSASVTPPSTAAPEPGSLALLLPVVGVAGMVIRKRRRK